MGITRTDPRLEGMHLERDDLTRVLHGLEHEVDLDVLPRSIDLHVGVGAGAGAAAAAAAARDGD